MRKRLWILVLALLLLLVCALPAAALENDAFGAVLIDAESGRVLYEKDSHEELYPASTTKVMTALLVLENLSLTDMVNIPEDFSNPGEASIWLEPGETLSVEDLMQAMLLRSANDAALALAIAVGGSEEEFVNMMNRRAVELGLKDTHFVNPHGLHDELHYTSAYDLAMIARAATDYDVFNRIIVNKKHFLDWSDNEYQRVVYNHNSLLNRYEYADGIKNGYTQQAGSCLVGSASKNDMRLIGVVLHCSLMYDAMEEMLEYGFSTYHRVSVLSRGETLAQLPVAGKKGTVPAILSRDVNFLLKEGETADYTLELELPETLSALPVAGDVLGSAVFHYAGGETYRVELLAGQGLPGEQSAPGEEDSDFGDGFWHSLWLSLSRMARVWVWA